MNLFFNKLLLSNFRNYNQKELVFYKKIVFIIGQNASGKSSLLEAIQTLSLNADSWIESEKQLISFGQEYFKLKAEYSLEERHWQLEFRGGNPSIKNIKLNGIEYRSFAPVKEHIPKTISFRARESLEIVKGSPSERRGWLDGTLKVLNIKYFEALRRYTRILEQRNSLLKTFSEKKRDKKSVLTELALWDSEMAKYGFYLMQIRNNFLQEIENTLNQNYQNIANKLSSEQLSLKYLPRLENCQNEKDFEEQLILKHDLDLIRGQTSIGAHKDDFLFLIDGKEARHFASQGQQRTCALALKMVQVQYWQNKLEYAPVLLLDDVAAELDLNRQNSLFEHLPTESQVFITTTHLQHLPNIESSNYQIINL